MRARGPPGPAWDNRSAREAESRSERRLSHAAVSKHAVAALCHPRKGYIYKVPCRRCFRADFFFPPTAAAASG